MSLLCLLYKLDKEKKSTSEEGFLIAYSAFLSKNDYSDIHDYTNHSLKDSCDIYIFTTMTNYIIAREIRKSHIFLSHA